ncbi:MAG: hypothetical protein ACXWNK_18385, partial [Vulcanimicrobiaceae bacterium]
MFGRGTECVFTGGGGAQYRASVTGSWDATNSNGQDQTVNQSNGAVVANVNGLYGSQASYQVAANNTTYNVQTLRPDQIQIGVTNYLPNGTLYVDPNTHVATAHVTGADGTTYVVTGSPDSAGGFDIEIDASNGKVWTENVLAPSSTASIARHADSARHTMDACGLAIDAERYFGGVSSVAGGVAVVAAMLGAEPVAAVASGVMGMTGAD